MQPADFSRRILLIVTGLTPQVVTETVFALAVDQKPFFVPTEIHLITTAEGAERARLTLLDSGSGQFYKLCQEYLLPAIDFCSNYIHVIEDISGQTLTDIRTPEDNARAADFIVHYVRKFCQDNHAALHVSIAGGRKSMGFFAGYALSLFGRGQDRLSHVLVSEPFESLYDFFYPPLKPCVLYNPHNSCPAHTEDAKIMLADIPFVRIRGGMPSTLLEGKASFAEAVYGAQSGLSFASLHFNYDECKICCGNKWIRFSPILFAFYLWLARYKVSCEAEDGFLYWRNTSSNEFLDIYETIVGSMSGRLERTRKVLQYGFDAKFFEEKVSKINRKLREALPLNACAYLIATNGRKPVTRYGLTLHLNQIYL